MNDRFIDHDKQAFAAAHRMNIVIRIALNQFSFDSCYERRMRVAPIILWALLALGGCEKPVKKPEPPSDPTDYFFRWRGLEGAVYPPIRWHERKPGRLYETTLRPTEMAGVFPTAYLSRITRNYQPWAERIYDVAYGGFDLTAMSPLPPEKGISSSNLVGNEVQIEIGGWSRSTGDHPRWLGKIYKGHMETRGHDIFVEDGGRSFHYFTAPEASDLDGRPVVVECMKVVGCKADLTVPQEIAGLPPMREGELPGRSIGARLAIAFHSDRVDDWPEIRRKAVCFAAFSIQKLDAEKIAPRGRLRCSDVRAAIAKTIGRT
jgi:hypothetical protein